MAEALGCASGSGTSIHGVEQDGARVTGIRTDAGVLHRRSLRAGPRQLFHPAPRAGGRHPGLSGQGLPITVPVADAAMAPESTVMDETGWR